MVVFCSEFDMALRPLNLILLHYSKIQLFSCITSNTKYSCIQSLYAAASAEQNAPSTDAYSANTRNEAVFILFPFLRYRSDAKHAVAALALQ